MIFKNNLQGPDYAGISALCVTQKKRKTQMLWDKGSEEYIYCSKFPVD